jgi:hypothetical protein
LPRGAYRDLTPSEVAYVQALSKAGGPIEISPRKAAPKAKKAEPGRAKPAASGARGSKAPAPGKSPGRAARPPRGKNAPKVGQVKRTSLAKVRQKSKKK